MSLQEPITMKKLNKFTPPNIAIIDSEDIKRGKNFSLSAQKVDVEVLTQRSGSMLVAEQEFNPYP